jgi:SsrA-binding protein
LIIELLNAFQIRQFYCDRRVPYFWQENIKKFSIKPSILAKKGEQKTKSAPPKIENRKAGMNIMLMKPMRPGCTEGNGGKIDPGWKSQPSRGICLLEPGEVWLKNMYIKPYEFGSYSNHDERRDRKLLLKKKEIREIDKRINQKGFTLIPLKLYFKGGYVKILIGLARGKKQFDKREDIKEKDVRRELDRKIKGSYSVNL